MAYIEPANEINLSQEEIEIQKLSSQIGQLAYNSGISWNDCIFALGLTAAFIADVASQQHKINRIDAMNEACAALQEGFNQAVSTDVVLPS